MQWSNTYVAVAAVKQINSTSRPMKMNAFLFLIASISLSRNRMPDQLQLNFQIEKVNVDFTKASNAEDAAALATLYAQGAKLMFSSIPAIQGRRNVEAFFQHAMHGGSCWRSCYYVVKTAGVEAVTFMHNACD